MDPAGVGEQAEDMVGVRQGQQDNKHKHLWNFKINHVHVALLTSFFLFVFLKIMQIYLKILNRLSIYYHTLHISTQICFITLLLV